MREIKFRGKRIDNGEWVYGSYVADVEWAKYYIYQNELRGAFWQLVRYEVDEKTVGQFTSLADRNGVRIYAGDILQFSDKAEWYRSSLFLKPKEEQEKILNDNINYPLEKRAISIPEDYEWLLSNDIQVYWEIIGNITDNPKLLEDK